MSPGPGRKIAAHRSEFLNLRRLVLTAGVVAATFVAGRKVLRRASPLIRVRCSEMAERMLASMPESFPPNRMLRRLDAIEKQTTRILELVETPPRGRPRSPSRAQKRH